MGMTEAAGTCQGVEKSWTCVQVKMRHCMDMADHEQSSYAPSLLFNFVSC